MNEAFWYAYEWYQLNEILETDPYEGGWMEWPAAATQVLAAFRTERNIERKESGAHDHGANTA